MTIFPYLRLVLMGSSSSNELPAPESWINKNKNKYNKKTYKLSCLIHYFYTFDQLNCIQND